MGVFMRVCGLFGTKTAKRFYINVQIEIIANTMKARFLLMFQDEKSDFIFL